jgi:hypothetical protein
MIKRMSGGRHAPLTIHDPGLTDPLQRIAARDFASFRPAHAETAAAADSLQFIPAPSGAETASFCGYGRAIDG